MSSIADHIELVRERELWRDRALSAEASLESAAAGLRIFQEQLSETRRQLGYTQELLKKAIEGMGSE